LNKAEQHNAENHDRLIQDHVHNDPFFRAFKVTEIIASENGNKLTLVLLKKEIEGQGFVMVEADANVL
jgi:hypothetical protein